MFHSLKWCIRSQISRFYLCQSVRSINLILQNIFSSIMWSCRLTMSNFRFDILFTLFWLRHYTSIIIKVSLRFQLNFLLISSIFHEPIFYLLWFGIISHEGFLVQRWWHIFHACWYSHVLFFCFKQPFFSIRFYKTRKCFFFFFWHWAMAKGWFYTLQLSQEF